VQTTKRFVTINPFWDNIGSLIHSEKAISLYQAECDKRFCARYAFAIADPASVAFVAEYLHPHAIRNSAGNDTRLGNFQAGLIFWHTIFSVVNVDVNIQQQKQLMQDQQLQRRTLRKTFYRILLDKGLLLFPNE